MPATPAITKIEETAHWTMRHLAVTPDGSEVITACYFDHPRYFYREALAMGERLSALSRAPAVKPVRLLMLRRESSDDTERCAASPEDAIHVLVTTCGVRRDDARAVLKWHKDSMAGHVWIRDGVKAEPRLGRAAGTIGRIIAHDNSDPRPWRGAPTTPELGGYCERPYLVVEVYRDHTWKAELAAEAAR